MYWSFCHENCHIDLGMPVDAFIELVKLCVSSNAFSFVDEFYLQRMVSGAVRHRGGCYNCGEHNHNQSRCRYDHRIKCTYCHNYGHKVDCAIITVRSP